MFDAGSDRVEPGEIVDREAFVPPGGAGVGQGSEDVVGGAVGRGRAADDQLERLVIEAEVAAWVGM